MRTWTPIAAALLAGTATWTTPALASPEPVYTFNQPAEDLGTALRAVAARAGLELYAQSREVDGVVAPALQGDLSARAAVARLLEGTALHARLTSGAIVIGLDADPAAGADQPPPAADIVVTGTHIRGGAVTAPVITLSAADMQTAGQTDLGEALRAVPQNFAGGQNPGVGWGVSGFQNVNSASNVDLRGLGPDATLTLLNGHRLPYDGTYSGVDVAAIPVAAVDHIDIVTDGASALYGSDAVAGVVNVVLKRDVEGITTSTQIGTATEGGDVNQQADLVAGTHWNGGGIFIAYDFAHNSEILAAQRSYAASMGQGSVVYPGMTRNAVLVSGHQALADDVTFKLDGTFNNRDSNFGIGTGSGANLVTYLTKPTVRTFDIAPELDVRAWGSWLIKVFGSVGQDNSHYRSTDAGDGIITVWTGCYCDTAYSAEIDADGPLFRLPGGTAHLAVGAGWRDNRQSFTYFTDGVSSEQYDAGQHSFYSFGELSLPIVGPEQKIPGLHRLLLSAAGRYEDYPGMAHEATPKLGALYEPMRDVTVKVSWGKSFKAPTLYELGLPEQSYLIPADAYGIGNANQALLLYEGGNPDLKPETATTLTAGLTIHPAALPGLTIGGDYFNIRYHNRVLQVLTSSAEPISTPGYGSLITYNPSAATVAQLLANSPGGVVNYTGSDVDPSSIVAVEDGRYLNIASQLIRGVDFNLGYRTQLGAGATLEARFSGTYLTIDQKLTASLPATEVAGTVFNPPKLKFRAGLTYARRDLTVAAFVNYTGGLTDNLAVPTTSIPATATLDLDAHLPLWRRSDGRPGVVLSLIVNNLFDTKPPVIVPIDPTETPYDSTNYSPIGRMIGFGLTRSW